MIYKKNKDIIILFKAKYEQYTGNEFYIIWGFMIKFANEIADVPIEEIEKRVDIFFGDEWYSQDIKRLTFASFVKNFNSFVDKDEQLIKEYKKLLERG